MRSFRNITCFNSNKALMSLLLSIVFGPIAHCIIGKGGFDSIAAIYVQIISDLNAVSLCKHTLFDSTVSTYPSINTESS